MDEDFIPSAPATVPMIRPEDRVEHVVAQVAPADVPAWQAAGWSVVQADE